MNKVFKAFNITYAILAVILFWSEQSYCQKPQVAPEFQFLYVKDGAFDVYRKGQRTGVEVHVLFSGEIEVYGRYHKSKLVLERTGQLTDDQIDTLKYYFKKVGFSKFPNHLPRSNRIFVPAPDCIIGYRENKTDSMKIVQAILCQKKEYYPKGFFNLRSKIESMLFDKKNVD